MCRKLQLLSLPFLLCTTWSIVTYIDAAKPSRCATELRVLWSRAVGSAPFASVPLVSYVDGDDKLDIVAALSTGDVYVLQGENGQNPAIGRWPYTAQQTSVHASPIQYDLDGDGVLDILILTTAGEFVGLKPNSDPIVDKHAQLPPVYVARGWNKNATRADGADINKYIMESPPEAADEASYVAVGPRVLASAVLTDIAGNGVPDHLIIPVSYYVEPSEYMRSPDTAQLPDVYNYLASALVIFNLTSMRPTRTILMELTKVTSEHPGYILFSPTVADLDSNGTDLEIIVVTLAGYLHVVNAEGQVRPGFPIHTGIPCGQVAVEDVNRDGQMELVVADVTGHVTCYGADGRELWKAQISGSCTGGPLVADLRLLGTADIAVATDDGWLWVLDGVTGHVVTGWPVKVATSLSAPVLVTRLSHTAVPSLVILADDHHIHIVSGDGKCRQTLNVGQLSFVSMSSHDLVAYSPGLELLVASRDGTVLCVGQAPHHQGEPLSSLYSSPAEHVRSGAAYYNGKRGIIIVRHGDTEAEFSGSTYTLTVQILDSGATPDAVNNYRVHVLLGNELLATRVYNSTGQYDIDVAVPPRPLTAQIQVRLTTRHSQVFTDHLPVRFHTAFIGDLQWLLVVPTLLVATLLLFTHGFPAVDLLPRSLASKGS